MSVIFELGIIIGIAAVLALLAKWIKQPPIIAYLIAGIIVGPLFLGFLNSVTFFESFSHIAVAFLLFIVGLNLDFRILKNFGKESIVIGLGQIFITSFLGFYIGRWLGFDFVSAIYIAVALAFSSTFVVIKLISDKKEIESLHGKIALGILIVQDFVAALVLTIVPVVGVGGGSLIFIQLTKVAILTLAVFLFSYLIIPGVFHVAARNQEILLMFGLSWALLISLLYSYAGFSIEIGALIAGVSLASSKYSLLISSKTRGLRDFFVLLFFVFFGSQLTGPFDRNLIISAVVFSVFILVGNPLIIMSLMKFLGYKKRTNFLTGVSLAQISEFSLVFVLLGFTSGIISQQVFSLTILIALVTIGLSSYMMFYSHNLFILFSPLLSIFDSNKKKKYSSLKKKNYNTVVFGYNRLGYSIVEALKNSGKSFYVVDYNPDTVDLLVEKEVPCVYGDARDNEFLDDLSLEDVKLVISTIPDLEANLVILRNLNSSKIAFVPTAHYISDAKKLYDEGADYVIMPHFLGGELASHLLVKSDFSKPSLAVQGKKQLKELMAREKEGQSHPNSDFHGK